MKNKFLLILSILFINNLAQTNSFYSQFGIGEFENSSSIRRMGMGDLGVALVERDFLSSFNPASWSSLNLTRLDISAKFNSLFVSRAGESGKFNSSGFNNFSLGFPVYKDYGIAFALGITPFSTIFYEISEKGKIESNNYEIDKKGEGGISKLYIGSSFILLNSLRLGVSLDYYTGDLNYSNRIRINKDESLINEYIDHVDFRGLGLSFGAISPDLSNELGLKSIKNLNIGVMVNTFSNVKTELLSTKKTYVFEDTLTQYSSKSKFPMRATFGLAFNYSVNYTFYVDYMIQNWTSFSLEQAANVGTKISFLENSLKYNHNKVSLGMEYRVNPDGINFDDLMIYRLGASYESLPIDVSNNRINQFSVSAGMSVPLSKENTIDFSVQYINRGSSNNALIKEHAIRIGLGISFGELWFFRIDR